MHRAPLPARLARPLGIAAFLATTVALLVLDPTTVLARAGGASGGSSGGGHSGGGSGSFHSGGTTYYGSGGGSGTGGPTGWAAVLIVILFFGGFFGLIALVAYLSSRSRRRTTTPQSFAADPGGTAVMYGAPLSGRLASGPAATLPGPSGPGSPPPAPPGASQDGVAAIQAADPGFDTARFLDRCQAAFFLLQKAWMDRDIDEGRAYMSSGLYQGWSVQVQTMIANHQRDVLDGLYVEGMQIVRATHDQNYDTVTVRIAARCSDYIVNDQTGKQISGSKRPEDWVEFWTFQRSAGAKTLTEGGITERKCPNCGAPLQVNQQGACDYCHAPVTSGRFDWVLVRIDQQGEFAA